MAESRRVSAPCSFERVPALIEHLKAILGAIGISLLLIVGIELAARSMILIRDTVASPEHISLADPDLDVFFQHADYDMKQLVAESSKIGELEYQPYAVWNWRPFQGDLITIQEDGWRATQFNSSRDDALRVWVFGGSTIWGSGSPDAGTIPSHLAYILNEEWGVDSRVRNIAGASYVSTQEVIALVRLLQLGNRPDVVIFYDGGNDSSIALVEPDPPGAHGHLARFRELGRGSESDSPFVQLIRESGSFRITMFALRRLGVDLQASAEGDTGDQSPPLEHAPRLGESALQVSVEAYRTADALAKAYGFDTLFFFQPILGGGEKPLHEAEQIVLEAARQDPVVQRPMEVYKNYRRAVQEYDGSGPVAIHDLSDVFEGVTEPVFFDWIHITDRGNRIVATRIFETLQAQLCESTPPMTSSRVRDQIAERCS